MFPKKAASVCSDPPFAHPARPPRQRSWHGAPWPWSSPALRFSACGSRSWPALLGCWEIPEFHKMGMGKHMLLKNNVRNIYTCGIFMDFQARRNFLRVLDNPQKHPKVMSLMGKWWNMMINIWNFCWKMVAFEVCKQSGWSTSFQQPWKLTH